MSSVPYIFANTSGIIPLSDLDANFANVKAAVDTANTANIVTGNVQTNITSVGVLSNLSVSGNVYTAGFTSTVGNVISGRYFIGDGSLLTNVSAYTNANVSAYLPTYTGNLVSLTGPVTTTSSLNGATLTATGNITAGNITTTGVVCAVGNIRGGNLKTPGIISATGNITGGNILTDGIVCVAGNVASENLFAAENLIVLGNITSGNLAIGSISASNLIIATANIIGGNLITDGVMAANGNIRGSNINTGGNVTATGNVIGGNVLTNGLVYGNISSEIIEAGNITSNNMLTVANLTISGGAPLTASDTTIAFKIPVTINGNVYYISLTAAQ